jgi:hypothetical protein
VQSNQDSYSIDVSDGPDTSKYEVDRSRKIKDYFTGCLPWPQKGTASFINDIGNLAVESVPQYPFGHTIKAKRKGGNDTIQIKRKTKIIIKITSNSLTSMLGDSVISSISGIVLGSTFLFVLII